jgi:two-component system response regulator HydG
VSARQRRNLLDKSLAHSESSICILDHRRRIRFVSPGLSRLVGWSPQQLEGQECEISVAPTADPVELFASAIAPTHDVLSGKVNHATCVIPRKDMSVADMRICHVPISDDTGSVVRIIVILSPAEKTSRHASGEFAPQTLHAEITALRMQFRQRFRMSSVIGKDSRIQRAVEQAQLLSPASSGYTIVGPDGSGRRHLAKVIHGAGPMADQSFVALSCQLLTPEELLRVVQQLKQLHSQTGTVPHAHTGTLLLTDAHHTPREVQQWVLDNLPASATDIRLAATSQVPLHIPQQEGWIIPEFRQRLSAVEIHLPSLHARGNDVLLLAQHFVEESRRLEQTTAEGISPQVADAFRFYRWPGNIAELKQAVFAACRSSHSHQIDMEDLPFAFRTGTQAQDLTPNPDSPVHDLDDLLLQFEKQVLLNTLAACEGNKAEAARRLGLTRPKLYRRLQRLSIDADAVDDRDQQNSHPA